MGAIFVGYMIFLFILLIIAFFVLIYIAYMDSHTYEEKRKIENNIKNLITNFWK